MLSGNLGLKLKFQLSKRLSKIISLFGLSRSGLRPNLSSAKG